MSRRALLGTLAALTIVVSGCGGSDSDSPVSAESSGVTSAVTSTQDAATGEPLTPTTTAPVYLPPFIDRVVWTQTDQGSSLQVFPTESGRNTQGIADLDASWAEVVNLDPTADTPGMRDQYACHWRFARVVDPDKVSWNLEPWRPVVTDSEMIATRCNPGGAEESIR